MRSCRELSIRVNERIQSTMEPMAVDNCHSRKKSHLDSAGFGLRTMVIIMKKSSHPGVWRMINRVYSLSKEHIQENACRVS